MLPKAHHKCQLSCVQDATVDELYANVFERMKGDMSSDTNVDSLRLYTAGT